MCVFFCLSEKIIILMDPICILFWVFEHIFVCGACFQRIIPSSKFVALVLQFVNRVKYALFSPNHRQNFSRPEISLFRFLFMSSPSHAHTQYISNWMEYWLDGCDRKCDTTSRSSIEKCCAVRAVLCLCCAVEFFGLFIITTFFGWMNGVSTFFGS